MPNDVTVDLGNEYIGSAYSPQVEITETPTGHEIAITHASPDAAGQLVTDSFFVPNYSGEEADREAAEAARAAAEAQRAAAESEREAYEGARQSAESGRASAESARDAAETERASAESARAAAESARATAEQGRASAESARVAAEQARAASETARESASATAVHNAEVATAAAQSATTAAQSATSAATTATTNANAATAAANTATANANAATSAAQAATTAANTAAQTANTAAAAADTAREGIQDDLADMRADIADKAFVDAYAPLLTAGAADGIKGGGPTVDAAFMHRDTGGGQASDGPATIEVIRGNTVRWNQLVANDAYWNSNSNTTRTVSSGVITVTATSTTTFGVYRNPSAIGGGNGLVLNHVYCGMVDVNPSVDSKFYVSLNNSTPNPPIATAKEVSANTWSRVSGIGTLTSLTNAALRVAVGGSVSIAVGDSFQMKNVMLFDLTTMFGSGNEPSTVPEFEKMFPAEYYPYSETVLLSVNMAGIECADADGNVLARRSIPATNLRSAGSVYDELRAGERITRVGHITFDGSSDEAWVLGNGGAHVSIEVPDVKLASTNSEVFVGVCNRFANLTPDQTWTGALAGVSANRAAHKLTFSDGTGSITVDAWKAQLAANPVAVNYALDTPTTTPIDPPLNMSYRAEHGGTETVLVPTGEMSAPVPMTVVYGSTPDGILDRSASMLAAQDGPTATANHGVGDYLTMGGTLYRVTTAIASGEAIVPGTNVTATTVMAEILSLIQ